jgi:hypothetical protein
MIVLSYYSPLEIQHAMQELHNACVDILAVVADVVTPTFYKNKFFLST